MIGNAIQYPLLSDYDPQTKTAKTVVKFPGNSLAFPGTSAYGLVKFGDIAKSGVECGDTCVPACCSRANCRAACTCDAACFSVTFYDNLAPRVARVSVTEGGCIYCSLCVLVPTCEDGVKGFVEREGEKE
jgi:hypothetical protein